MGSNFKTVNEQEIKPIRIYEYIDKENKFKEIEKKFPLHDNLVLAK